MLRITTQTLAVNAAFLREIKDDHEELHRLFAESMVVLTGQPAAAQVSELMAQLLDQVLIHFQLEEAFGYFEDALVDQPWLGERAETLRAQHGPLTKNLERLTACAASIPNDDSHQLSGLLTEFQQFLNMFRQHERDEIDLIMLASTEDVGVAG